MVCVSFLAYSIHPHSTYNMKENTVIECLCALGRVMISLCVLVFDKPNDIVRLILLVCGIEYKSQTLLCV